MTGKGRDKFYKEAYEVLKQEAQNMNVVMVAEGDLLFYSTYGYIQNLANADGLKCSLIPGIPAFVAASSVMQKPLVGGNRSMQVLALPESFEQIKSVLEKDVSLVIMKMKVLKGWYDFLQTINRPFFYIEQVGTVNEFSSSDIEVLKDRTIPYFAMIIFN